MAPRGADKALRPTGKEMRHVIGKHSSTTRIRPGAHRWLASLEWLSGVNLPDVGSAARSWPPRLPPPSPLAGPSTWPPLAVCLTTAAQNLPSSSSQSSRCSDARRSTPSPQSIRRTRRKLVRIVPPNLAPPEKHEGTFGSDLDRTADGLHLIHRLRALASCTGRGIVWRPFALRCTCGTFRPAPRC